MKNSLKIVLTAGFMVVAFGAALTFCSPKSEKPVAETQDTLKSDKSVVVESDTTKEAPTQDSTTSK